ncbi:FecR domain-containing protein [Methylobacillus arboreus]|uniref:FecR domain-containing protein n=1 Tax=Methylobacillus arboreus TaxID=755170 RepID=UPI001E5C9026|nr:FecR domain-containing protein [Methylobacillus arboreus]MCB5190768.1 FecR domain-containing protein [Methylobacillus arboreus]
MGHDTLTGLKQDSNAGARIDPKSIPARVAQKAVEWLVEIKGSDDAKLHQQLADWLSQDPDHLRAWQRIAEVNANLSGASTALGSAMAQAAMAAPQSAGRRRSIKMLSMLIFATGSGWVLTQSDSWTDWQADEYTGTGEYKTLRLADGTQLMLNSNSAVNVRYTAQHRKIDLLRGEIMVATAKDAQQRPMQVATHHGLMQPLGTRFNVRLDQDFSQLAVLEGKVALSAAGLPQQEIIVMPGELVMFSVHGLGERLPWSERSVAWVDGMLVVSQMRLEDFLRELGRHRRGIVRCDPALADLRISGSFPLADTELILKNLASILPLKIQYITRYWVNLMPV